MFSLASRRDFQGRYMYNTIWWHGIACLFFDAPLFGWVGQVGAWDVSIEVQSFSITDTSIAIGAINLAHGAARRLA